MRGRRILLNFCSIAVILTMLFSGIPSVNAKTNDKLIYQRKQKIERVVKKRMKRVTQKQREDAAARMAQKRAKVRIKNKNKVDKDAPIKLAMAMPMPGGTPDYFGSPNWAFSPPLKKFVDTLPLLGTANNLGQYI
ncbi:MAG TPA: hypothetical protein PLU24_05360, partial [Candidatus Omnitrophota bacterium]|nr:hypothetical protein [Candidatus Omnitrophota bacterium]